jgi:hypothetical protein
MINLEDLTNKQQLVIAEFIFAFRSDTLIKSEAEDLIEVFKEHHVPEAYVANLSIEDTIDLLTNNMSPDTAEEILKKYFRGEL